MRAAADYTIETIPNVRLSDRYNHVSNPDAIIRPDDVARINRLLQTVEDSLGIEVAVVAVESIGENDARMFATDLFQHWGLGKKGEDNGLLIQLVTGQRAVVFETGYGLEGVLPDAICYRLQQPDTVWKASCPMPSATACNSNTCSPTSKRAITAAEC